MSGGKDAQVMAAFFLEYKKNERPDLELELITFPLPAWKYSPELYYDKFEGESKQLLIEQRRLLDNNIRYWEERGIPTVNIETTPGINDDFILNADKPCMWCFIGLNRSLYKYLENQYKAGKRISLAIGITKFDLLYLLVSLTIRSGGKDWDYYMKHSPGAFDFNRMQIALFSPYPCISLGIPGTKINKITPLINFTDNETRSLANHMQFPRIPDICIPLFGEKFNSDKRYFDKYLMGTTTEDINLDHEASGFFRDYDGLLKIFYKVGVLPPIEYINGILYKSFYNDEITSIFKNKEN